MTSTYLVGVRYRGRALAAAAITGPLIALLPQLWPVVTVGASEPAPGSAPRSVPGSAPQPAAPQWRVAAVVPLAVAGHAAGRGSHPAGGTPSPPAASARQSGPVGGPAPAASAPTPAASGSAASPQLSIGVDDGRQAVRAGDPLTYTVKIHNIGAKGAPGLDIVQTLPAGLKLISADRHAMARAGQVTWKLNLPAGATDTFHVVGQVGQTPRQLLRLATIACATVGGGARPIVCAAHSDQLPAGAGATGRMRHTVAGRALGYLLPLCAALVVCAAAAILGRRLTLRRRAQRTS